MVSCSISLGTHVMIRFYFIWKNKFSQDLMQRKANWRNASFIWRSGGIVTVFHSLSTQRRITANASARTLYQSILMIKLFSGCIITTNLPIFIIRLLKVQLIYCSNHLLRRSLCQIPPP